MKLLDKILNRKPKTLSDAEFDKVFHSFVRTMSFDDMWAKGEPYVLVGDKALQAPYKQVASVYKAVKAICDNIPQAYPIFVDVKTGEEVEDPKLQELIDRPNPNQSWNDFIQAWAGHYALSGEAFIYKVMTLGQSAGIKGLPAQLKILRPSAMVHEIDKNTLEIAYWRYGSSQIPIESIIHTKDFNPYDDYRGLSPLVPIEQELEIDRETLQFNKNFFRNDATPNFVLSTDKVMTPEQRERVLAWWEARHKGSKKAFRSALLEGGLQPKTIANTHKDMDFIEQKRFSREEIIGEWRSPKALFNITEDLNYATFVGQMKIFWIYTLMPIIRKFEDSVNMNLIAPYNPNIYLMFDVKNVPAFVEDFYQKVDVGSKLFTMGFTRNEINDKLELGFDEQEWGDDWWLSAGMTTASSITEGINNPEPPPTQDTGKEPIPPVNKDQSAENTGKSQKRGIIQRTPLQMAVLKAFSSVQISVENRMDSKLKRYFFELRKDVLALSDTQLASGNIDIDWAKQNGKVKKLMQPVIESGVQEGIKVGQAIVQAKKSINDDQLNHRIASMVEVKANKITRVNETIKRKIGQVVEQTIREGQSTTGTAVAIEELGSKVREALRMLFNNVSARARLIARTESAGAVNGGTQLYYHSEGVQKKEWLTAHDELVRESHRQCESEGAIDMAKHFSNGLEYPADQNGDASEICNCRCVILPVIENE